MNTGVSRLTLDLTGASDTDADELQLLAEQLRRALLELDVEDVQLSRQDGAAPEGAKPGEVIAVGALVVTTVPLLVRQVLQVVDTWLRNRPLRSVTVEIDGDTIELGNASAEDQRRLIDAFVTTRSPQAGTPQSGE
ncbi:hypothetical protein [Streptomyces decoyicus]|uniref:hypothetical protein n=1 Tax=Streptomyces decoyicus TaxID=249567 RepID=UPI0004AA1B95|nr:hypothetical protein [Streptomyces decoyicus]KOG38532.1 hypothetical protein ADK74_32195 [Streptomyces decoyicus]QZY18669.1 hypothetical protein K7C20_28300 [Streptomyces decoyicus]